MYFLTQQHSSECTKDRSSKVKLKEKEEEKGEESYQIFPLSKNISNLDSNHVIGVIKDTPECKLLEEEGIL